MIRYLRDLWILTDNGINIFTKEGSRKIDEVVLAAFNSAVRNFFQIMFDETLQRFTSDKFEYKILGKRNLLFVATFSLTTKEKTALYELNYVAERFCELYPKQMIDNWNHDMHKFDAFQNEVKTKNELIGEKIDQLWDHGQSICCCQA
ncbi:MAG: hypothetical protein ACFE96_17450 [Candidatus Hermodarchaeota archaeon]